MTKHRAATTPAKRELDELLASIDSAYLLGKRHRKRSPAAIRGALAARHAHANHLFLRLAVDPDEATDDAALAAAWGRAVQALVDTDLTYAWGSRPRRERLRALARDPRMLAAIQGTVANSPEVRLDLLAVLVADGSEASLDALVPHLDPALVAQDIRLDRLQRLRGYAARTPHLDALFAALDAAFAARNAASPALALGPLIGVGEVALLWFRVAFGSRELTVSNVPRIQGSVEVDSRRARWLSVDVTRLTRQLEFETTWFGPAELDDALGLGRCEPAELPAWIARAARKLRVTWDDEPHVSSNLRGARRDAIVRWLLGHQRG
jgi:hypothetical protein